MTVLRAMAKQRELELLLVKACVNGPCAQNWFFSFLRICLPCKVGLSFFWRDPPGNFIKELYQERCENEERIFLKKQDKNEWVCTLIYTIDKWAAETSNFMFQIRLGFRKLGQGLWGSGQNWEVSVLPTLVVPFLFHLPLWFIWKWGRKKRLRAGEDHGG